MATTCPYCNVEVRESEIEAEDGCCPECGASIGALSSFLDDPDDLEEYDEYEADIGDVAFPYFTGWQSRVKSLGDETYYYWLRSPGIGGTPLFWYVSYDGHVSTNGNANTTLGVCPCFFIGGKPNA